MQTRADLGTALQLGAEIVHACVRSMMNVGMRRTLNAGDSLRGNTRVTLLSAAWVKLAQHKRGMAPSVRAESKVP